MDHAGTPKHQSSVGLALHMVQFWPIIKVFDMMMHGRVVPELHSAAQLVGDVYLMQEPLPMLQMGGFRPRMQQLPA